MEQNGSVISNSTVLSEGSMINLNVGDPTIFEPFWKETGEAATLVIPGWHNMSYFSEATGHLCWFLEPDFANEVERLHRTVGNAITEGRHIIVGAGSTQLIQAALFALSSTEAQHPVSVVAAAPYYSSYPTIADFMKSGLFHWAGDAASFKGNSNFIEIVCSPNNPDGTIRDAVLDTESGKRVHDMAYYWPQYTPIREPCDQDIMLFTLSKAIGHAGTRIGWALVKDKEVAERMVTFLEVSSIGVSKVAQLRAAKTLKVVSDAYELPDLKGAGQLFHFGQRLLADRWERLREAVQVSGRFSLPEFSVEFCNFVKKENETYPGFAWLHCEDKEIKDCEDFLKSIKVLSRGGKHFGVGPEYARISMVDSDEKFNKFIERVSSLK